MKYLLLSLLFGAQALCAQQSTIRGEVSILNSKYETKTRQYVANAQVEEDFDRATPQTTDAVGRFDLVVKGVKDQESITFSVKKEGLEVVNFNALTAVAGQKDWAKIYMTTPQKLAEYRKQYFNVGKTAAEKALQEKLAQLQKERQTLLADQHADKNRISALETQLAALEAQRAKIDETARELARRYERINLDDASPLFQEAFSWFQKGELEHALDILRQADLAGQARNILAERGKISAIQREVPLRDSVQKQRTADVLPALNLKADLHTNRFEFDSVEQCYELMMALDSSNYDYVFQFAYFLAQQNNLHKAARFYEKSLALSKDEYRRSVVLNNLGNVHRANQKMPEAEKAYTEALGIRRKLAEKNLDAFLPDVAQTLNNLGNYYRTNQKMPEAEKAYTEALGIRRKLAEKNPNAFLPGLATTLNDLGNYYRANQKMREAEKAYIKALGIRRQLAEKNPDAFMPDVAMTLNNLGEYYRDNQKMPEAEKAYIEALGIHRKLVEKNPDAFLPDVAMTLNNLGNFYSDNQKMPEAEKAYTEALSIQRKLAEKNPDAFMPDVATTLNNLGIFCRENQKMPEAEKSYTEALSIQRQLAEKNPDAFLSDVAKTLNNLGAYYYANQKIPEAEKVCTEALGIYRQLAEKNPDAFLSYVAATLNNLGVFYRDNQKMPEAEKAYTEALGIRRTLAEKNLDAFLPDVATTLNNLGIFYGTNQKMLEAEKAYNEALDIYRTLAEKNPDAFLPDVALTLNNLGVFYRDNQKMSEAEKAYNEALDIYRTLAEKNPNAFLSYVATVRNNLGVFFKILKHYPKALDHYEEALHIRQADLLAGNLHFSQNWAQVLRNISDVKDSTEARKQYAETVRAGLLMASSFDSLRGVDKDLLELSTSEYGSASKWSIFAQNYALAEKAGLRCLALDASNLSVWTNIGHARYLAGHPAEAHEAWLHLKGQKDGEGRDYKVVLEKDWQDLEAAGVVPKGAFDAARKWLTGAW